MNLHCNALILILQGSIFPRAFPISRINPGTTSFYLVTIDTNGVKNDPSGNPRVKEILCIINHKTKPTIWPLSVIISSAAGYKFKKMPVRDLLYCTQRLQQQCIIISNQPSARVSAYVPLPVWFEHHRTSICGLFCAPPDIHFHQGATW